MRQVELNKIIIDEKRQDQIIVLKDKETERLFPIVIGFLEASSIKMKLAGVEPPRPMTHDLLVSVIEGLDGKLERLVIDKMIKNTFHARLEVLMPEGEVRKIDTRPSDGIALAVRTGAQIFIEDSLFDKVAVYKNT